MAGDFADSRTLTVFLSVALNGFENDLAARHPQEADRPSPLAVLTRFVGWLG